MFDKILAWLFTCFLVALVAAIAVGVAAFVLKTVPANVAILAALLIIMFQLGAFGLKDDLRDIAQTLGEIQSHIESVWPLP